MAKEELSRECNYTLEAANQRRFRDILSDSEGFYVPIVVDDISSKRVLTSELVTGNLSYLNMFPLIFPFQVNAECYDNFLVGTTPDFLL